MVSKRCRDDIIHIFALPVDTYVDAEELELELWQATTARSVREVCTGWEFVYHAALTGDDIIHTTQRPTTPLAVSYSGGGLVRIVLKI